MKFTWRIDKMRALNVGEARDVVVLATFTVTGQDGPYSASRTYSAHLLPHDEANFTPLANLDEATVIGWVKAALDDPGKIGCYSVEKEVSDAIDQQRRLHREVALPWATPAP